MARVCRFCSLPIEQLGNVSYHPACRVNFLKEDGARQYELKEAQEKLRYHEIGVEHKETMAKTVKHWNIDMGEEKLLEMFPDIAGVTKESK
jgi:hypothetical protein